MAYTYTDGAYSASWTVSGSSTTRMVGARLWYEVVDSATAYTVYVYGDETLYNDNVGMIIRGRLNLSGTSETTGSKTYTYSSGGTNHKGVYYTICGAKGYTWYKTKGYQYGSASMKAYRDNHESTHYSLASLSITVPPIWNYTVSYNANGGSGSIGNQTKWYTENLTLSNGAGFTRQNYKIIGWNTKADGTGTHYNLSATYTTNASVTLYAEWKLDTIPLKTKVGGAWKNAIVYVKQNGSWVLPHIGYIKDNGTWKQIK